MNRDHGDIQAAHHTLHAALERTHTAGAAYGAFGKDAHQMAGFHLLAGSFDGRLHAAQPVGDRNSFQGP